MKERLEKYRADNPKITEQFADLKRQLAEARFGGGGACSRVSAAAAVCCLLGGAPSHHSHAPPAPSTQNAQVSADQWEAIPDIGDYTVKRPKRETYAPAPDSLLAAAAAAAGAGGPSTTAAADGTASTVSNLTDIGMRAAFAASAPAVCFFVCPLLPCVSLLNITPPTPP
jgi:pre-mRNA-processing factor 6